MIGNSPGQKVKLGSMGRPLPGYRIELQDAEGRPGPEGEVCVDLSERPLRLMLGYANEEAGREEMIRERYYHTGDVASRDEDGYVTYIGRSDDVFKASDYRISPFELESVLILHPAIAEAAVVPSPDPVRLAVPKAFVILAPGHALEQTWPAVSSGSFGKRSLHTNVFVAWNSRTYRRPSRARFVKWTCGARSTTEPVA